MEFEGGGGIKVHAPMPGVMAVTESSASHSIAPHIDQESMWQMSFRAGENVDSGPYPERPGEPDCAYYLRTGLCRFGVACWINRLSVDNAMGFMCCCWQV